MINWVNFPGEGFSLRPLSVFSHDIEGTAQQATDIVVAVL